jgi:hypothetical protein
MDDYQSSGISYNSGYDLIPRPGTLGKILDFISPRIVPNDKPRGFTVKSCNGEIYYSKDGIDWTARDEPEES